MLKLSTPDYDDGGPWWKRMMARRLWGWTCTGGAVCVLYPEHIGPFESWADPIASRDVSYVTLPRSLRDIDGQNGLQRASCERYSRQLALRVLHRQSSAFTVDTRAEKTLPKSDVYPRLCSIGSTGVRPSRLRRYLTPRSYLSHY